MAKKGHREHEEGEWDGGECADNDTKPLIEPEPDDDEEMRALIKAANEEFEQSLAEYIKGYEEAIVEGVRELDRQQTRRKRGASGKCRKRRNS